MANHSQEPFMDLDLQLFAEGEGTPAEPTGEGTPPETEESGQPEQIQEDEFIEVVYNKEPVKVKKSEAPTYIQKGMNYDKVKTKAERYETALEKAARLTNHASVDDYLKTIEAEEQRMAAERMKEAGINDPKVIEEIIDRHPAVQQAKKMTAQQQLQTEAGELAADFKETFGREIKPEDVSADVLEYRNSHSCSLSEAFFFVNRKSIKTMMEKEKEAAARQALENHGNQKKRGVEASDEAPVSEKGLDFTTEEKAWAERRIRQGHYKDMKDAWAWLRGKKK